MLMNHKLRKMVGTLGNQTLADPVLLGRTGDLVAFFLEAQGGVEAAGIPIQSSINDIIQCRLFRSWMKSR